MEKIKSKWKSLWVAESEAGFWEIVNNSDDNTVKITYVPEDDNTEKDVIIEVPYDRFEDLVNFIVSIK